MSLKLILKLFLSYQFRFEAFLIIFTKFKLYKYIMQRFSFKKWKNDDKKA